MTDHDALLQAILGSPEDEGLRLVYADWLEERGDLDRAQFIRVQCELARLPESDPQREHLEVRERELLDKHEDEWLGPVLPLIENIWDEPGFCFNRGFVEEICLSATNFLREVGSLLRRHPIRRVRLVGVDEELEGLADCPFLARLTSLDLVPGFGGIDARGLRLILESPHLGQLSELSLTCASLGSAGMEILAASPVLGQLTGLHLSSCGLTPQAMQILTASPSIQGLTVLDVNNNTGIGEDGVRAIASCPYLAGLKSLILSFTNAGDGGGQAVAHSPYLRGLTELAFTDAFLGDAGLEALATSPNLSRLSTLCVDLCPLTPAGVLALARSPYLQRLAYLNLSAEMGEEVACVLARWPGLASLRHLYLGHGGVGDVGARALAGSASLSRLKTLGLWDNAIGDAGAQAIAGSQYLGGVSYLNMTDNPLSERGQQALRARFGDHVSY